MPSERADKLSPDGTSCPRSMTRQQRLAMAAQEHDAASAPEPYALRLTRSLKASSSETAASSLCAAACARKRSASSRAACCSSWACRSICQRRNQTKAKTSNARAAFVPSVAIRNDIRSEPRKLYARRPAQQRRGPRPALAVAFVTTWIEPGSHPSRQLRASVRRVRRGARDALMETARRCRLSRIPERPGYLLGERRVPPGAPARRLIPTCGRAKQIGRCGCRDLHLFDPRHTQGSRPAPELPHASMTTVWHLPCSIHSQCLSILMLNG